MLRHNLLFFIVAVISAIAVQCKEDSQFGFNTNFNFNFTEPKSNQEYHFYNSSSFSYRYKFDDGSIAAENGTFKEIRDEIYVFGKGCLRFEIRKKMYEFDYDVAEDGIRGRLFYSLPDGSKIEEKFYEPLNRSYSNANIVANSFDIARKEIRPTLGDFAFSNAVVFARFPASQHHPLFSCAFDGQANSWSTFHCRKDFFETYENRTETIIESTPNRPDPQWVDEQRRSLIRTLSSENHHDGLGQYKIDYVFDSGTSLKEVGKLNSDNSASFIEGFISFNTSDRIINFNYMANETTYAILLKSKTINSDDNEISECSKQFQIQYDGKASTTDSKAYSNLKSSTFYYAHRELTYIDGKAFVRASISVQLNDPVRQWERQSINFDINERHPYGEQSQQQGASAPFVVYISMVG